MDNNKIFSFFKRSSFAEIISYSSIVLGFFSMIAVFMIPEKYASRIGDFSGGVTSSLFSLAGVSLVLSTLSLQRKEMNSNQKAQSQQIFESAFFNLLTFHHEIVNAITQHTEKSIHEGSSEIIFLELKGRRCFEIFREYLFKQYEASRVSTGYIYSNKDSEIVFLNDVYLEFYEDHQSDLGHYFRNLYHIFKFIKLSKIEDSEKKRYAGLVRAQLSNDELILIFYNCLSDNGVEKFKPLVEYFHLMKNLNASTLIDKDIHFPLYDPKAYFKT